jgi:hypothetical protein
VWPCQGHGVCPNGGKQQILYGWAKGAAAMQLPKGVGYRVGSGTKIDNLVLQAPPSPSPAIQHMGFTTILLSGRMHDCPAKDRRGAKLGSDDFLTCTLLYFHS